MAGSLTCNTQALSTSATEQRHAFEQALATPKYNRAGVHHAQRIFRAGFRFRPFSTRSRHSRKPAGAAIGRAIDGVAGLWSGAVPGAGIPVGSLLLRTNQQN